MDSQDIKFALENNVGNLKDSNSIPKLLFSLYLLSYHSIGQPKADDINFQQFLQEARTRAKEVNDILNDKKKFLQAFEEFKASRIYEQKRAWCSLRDYLKSQEFRKNFFRSLGQEGYDVKDLRPEELFTQLELPGDVWNNRPKFRNCILKGTKYEKDSLKFPELLRKIYAENKPAVGYPEQFDITFDLVPKMCEQDRCEMCPYGLLNGKAKEFEKICVRDEKYYCPVLLVSCGYKMQCLGAECRLQKMKPHSKMDPILKEIEKIESEKINYQELSDDYFEYQEGKIPILISAPHGAKHLRNDKWKEEDEYTASIAIMLGKLTGAHVIYVKNATKEDPNYDLKSEYKEAIQAIAKDHEIKFIADLHGARNDRDFKVSVGIINDDDCSCPIYKEIIQKIFEPFQKDIFNLEGLKASTEGTVTYFAKNSLQIEAAQFEINGKYRIVERKPDSSKAKEGTEPDYKADEKDVIEMINTLRKMIEEINAKL